MPDTGDLVTATPHGIWWEDAEGKIGPYPIAPLSLKDSRIFQRIVAKHAMSPLQAAGAILESLPEPERSKLASEAREAQRNWSPPTLFDVDGRTTLLRTFESQTEFLEAILRRSKPDITEAEIDRVSRVCRINELDLLYQILLGVRVDPDADDPKAGAVEQADETSEEKQKKIAELSAHLSQIALWQQNLKMLASPYRWISNGSSSTSGNNSV